MSKKTARALRQTTRRLVEGRKPPQSATRRVRAVPRSDETSGGFIRRMLLDGRFTVDEMVEKNLQYFPDLKTNQKSVYYYHYGLHRSGELTTPWSAYRSTEAG